MLKEQWREIEDFPGYEVSNTGKVRSHWFKTKRVGTWGGYDRKYHEDETHELSQSDDGNGYMKVYLQNNTKRACKKVHRLVAEAFLPIPINIDDPTVDHIQSGRIGKLNNSVTNLRWISRRENIQKAYRDGVCDKRIERSKKEIIVTDQKYNLEKYFSSVQECAEYFNVHYTTISHIMKTGDLFRGRYEICPLLDSSISPKDILIYRDIGESTDEWF